MQEKLEKCVLENRARNVKVKNEVQFSTLLNNLAFEVNPKVHRYRTVKGTATAKFSGFPHTYNNQGRLKHFSFETQHQRFFFLNH